LSQYPEEKLLFSNILNLYTKILDHDYIGNILVKNLTKLNRLIANKDLLNQKKVILESKLIVEILVGFDNVHTDRAVFNGCLNLAENLLNLN